MLPYAGKIYIYGNCIFFAYVNGSSDQANKFFTGGYGGVMND
ncbi:hypothetical protein [Chitinophaga sp. MM2321]